MAEKIRYAMVGLGHIAQVAVLPAFRHAKENSELAALVSGDGAKLKQLARKYKVPLTHPYEEYEALLRSGEIDAVYIAVPNSKHAGFAERAANAGVHVLCEKPMASRVEDAISMMNAAVENKIKFMVAYRLHFEEANLKAAQLAHSGKLGEVRIFNSVFTMQVKEGNIRTRRELGGGTLFDIGIYCINAARYIFDAEPIEVTAFTASNGDPRFREIDEMTSAILRFPGDKLATFTSSFGAANAAGYQVVGTKGSLTVDPAYEYSTALKHVMKTKDKVTRQTFPKRDQFAPELIYFSDCILNDRDPEPSALEGLADLRVIEALYRSARERRPIQLGEFGKNKHPDLKQEIRRPPVKEPRLVHVEAPTE